MSDQTGYADALARARRGGPEGEAAMRSVFAQLGQRHVEDEIFRGRRRANRIIRVESPGTLAAGATSSVKTLRFRKSGEVLAMYGQVKEATDLGLANASVRIQLGGDREFVTDGSAGAFATFFALFGVARNHWPMYERVDGQTVWSLYFKNEHAANTYTPDLQFAFREDP